MSGPTIRPTFEVVIADDRDAVVGRLRGQLASDRYPVRIENLDGHFVVCPAERDVHFWSPWLDLQVESREDGTHVFGRFGPRPSIWTAFMCAHFSLGTLAFFAAMWGTAELMLGQQPLALWIALVCGVGLGLVYWASRVGQGLAHEQMAQIEAMVHAVLDSESTVISLRTHDRASMNEPKPDAGT